MSQQINLRPAVQRQDPLAAWVLTGLSLYLGVLAVIVVLQNSSVKALETDLARSQAEAQTLLTRIERASQGGAATGQIAALDQQIEALRARLSTNEVLIQKAKDGAIGLQGGHSSRLRALASVSEPGVWLESIEIDETGQQIGLSGNALGYREVVRYSAEANRAMQPFGIALGSADMSGGADGAGRAGDAVLKFTLK